MAEGVAAKLDSGDIMLSNPFGRKRFIYAQDSHERMKRGCHFYGCSTGADFISERMIAIWRELKLLPILQVHDELAYELDRAAGLKLRAQIAEIFHRPVAQLNGMVLPVEAKAARNYGKFSEDNPDGLRKVKL
jgi:DNA polymerase I-like protein with 3'-5' exonuclease and polymerase domains